MAFYNVYASYIDATLGPGDTPAEERFRLRNEVIARMTLAQRGLNAIGVGVAFQPPPMFAGRIPVMDGLPNTAFLHEQPGWRLEPMAGVKPTYVQVLEMLRLATSTLEAEIEEAKAERQIRSSGSTEGLRAVLGFPAYLLSLVFRTPIARFEEGVFGTALRVLAIAINALGVYVAGKAAKIW